MAQPQCPAGALTSFPLKIGFTPTSDTYKNIPVDNTELVFQWQPRSISPSFEKIPLNSGLIDEPTGLTTLRYNTKIYSLISVQIAQATHTEWLPTNQSRLDNKEDIIFIFKTSVSEPLNIMIVVPIIKNGTAQTDPLYLTALDPSSGLENGPFSLDDCVPRSNYIKYTSCLPGYSKDAPSNNALIYVDISGLSVSPTLMDSIKKNSFAGSNFPAKPTADFMNRFTSDLKTITSTTIGTNVAMSSRFVNSTGQSNKSESTDNYKCMPLDMAQIQTSDLVGAKKLTEILLPEQKEAKILNPGKLERGISIALGIIMGIMFFGLGIYMLLGFIKGSQGGVTETTTIVSKIYGIWPFILVLIIGIASGAAITVVTSQK